MTDILSNDELVAAMADVEHAIHLLKYPELHEDVESGGVCEECPPVAEDAISRIIASHRAQAAEILVQEGLVQFFKDKWVEVSAENERLKIDDHARRIAELDEGCRECALRERNAKLERVAEAAKALYSAKSDVTMYEQMTTRDRLRFTEIGQALAELEEDA